jgi:hypothetical protein
MTPADAYAMSNAEYAAFVAYANREIRAQQRAQRKR